MGQQIPKKFGKCALVKPLGKGATAVVYLARHEGLGIPVAVKVLRRRLSRSRPEYAERFLREARMAAWLEHPNIVRVIDCGIQQGYHYMVMDYVDGPNCLQMLQEGENGMDWQESVRIARQAAEGLAYAANHEVIHRDVKPSNIMIDSSGRARVTDLGLAKLTMKGMAALTQELQTVGTPNYMSPEQIRSPGTLDFRADIYSLGATLFHMVSGRPPFEAENNMGVIAKHLTKPVDPLYEVKPGLPAELNSIVSKMMAKSPDERYQDYDALSADLDSLLEGRTVEAVGFEETHLTEEEDQRLAQMLIRLGSERAALMVDEQDEDDDREPMELDEQRLPVAEASTSNIELFGPDERAEDGETSEDTVLRRDEGEQWVWVLLVVVILGMLFVLAVALMTFFGP